MTLIEALLLLPERGEPRVVGQKAAAALVGSAASMVRRHGTLWSLTDEGRRFLAQFRPGRPDAVRHVLVRLVSEREVPVFHLLCDDEQLLKVRKDDLRRSLHELQVENPGVKIVFEYCSSGRAQ